MPLYEYACDACGHKFEKIQKFSDPIETQCPKCGGQVRKLMSSPAIQFKGSGFYITDYAKKDQGGAAKSDRSDKSAGEKSDKAGSAEKADKSDSSTKSETTSTSTSSGDSSSSTTANTTTAKSST